MKYDLERIKSAMDAWDRMTDDEKRSKPFVLLDIVTDMSDTCSAALAEAKRGIENLDRPALRAIKGGKA